MTTERSVEWHQIDVADLEIGRVKRVVVDHRALAITHTADGYGVLDNACPHQGGPLGEGQIEDGCLLCPWHGYEYDPLTGESPGDYGDAATVYESEMSDDGLYVALPRPQSTTTLMDQVVTTMTEWGVTKVFGMVGHSNLGLADAMRRAEEDGRLEYIGIRHEGAAAFAASAYAKLTGRPAACFSIAGPGATNLLTGLWDAKVDRMPIVALTGQVNTQVLGPGAFQEIPTAAAFEAVAEWSQTMLTPENAAELMALAIKHAEVKRDVAHLILPNDTQELPGVADFEVPPRDGRVSTIEIAPPEAELNAAVELLRDAERPVIIVGRGARPHRREIIALAEHIDAPVITTFKAKGLIGDDHPLACGVLGRSGTPVAAGVMGRADALLVFGASFSNHTGISKNKPTIQVDFDRMILGKFHPVDIPLWGEIGRTAALLTRHLDPADRPETRDDIAERWATWREEKRTRSAKVDKAGRMHPARLFERLGTHIPSDAVIPVDVGNNTYAFGHYFESAGSQDVLMSGYLGSIGFALPAALGAAVAVDGRRRVVSISGDGGLGQYLAEFTTAVKYRLPIVHIVLNNNELAKISREQVGEMRPIWQTQLVNPDFAAYAELCGGAGFRITGDDDMDEVLAAAFAETDKPVMVEVEVSGRWV